MNNEASQKLPSGGAEREARELGKVGWMDATDYDHELGHALGGNLVHPDEEDCRKENPCINEIDPYPCQTKEVFVFDKAALEKLWAKYANEARLEALEQAVAAVNRAEKEFDEGGQCELGCGCWFERIRIALKAAQHGEKELRKAQ